MDALIAALRSDKADKNSPSFTGTPKSTTPTSSDNSMRIATTAFVQALISSLQTAVNTSIANKADKNSPTFTGDTEIDYTNLIRQFREDCHDRFCAGNRK